MIAAAKRGPVDDADLAERIAAGATQMGVPLTPPHVDRFVAYLRLIERWNATYNLTAVRDPLQMVSQHLLDCLAAAQALERRRGRGQGERLLDVGSGAGLPGLVIAAVSPDREIVCVDSVGKKTAFITQAAGVMGLKNVTAWHGRVEAMHDRSFHVIASRAFSSLSDFVAATRPLLVPREGTWMAMKGKNPEDELAALDSLTFHVEPLEVPGLQAERCIVWLSEKRAHA